MSRDEVRLSPTSLRGLAHPLRVRMLNALRADGPATATLLAQRLGQSTGATSYHLRQLAQYGFVVEEPKRGPGRERWWRAAHKNTILDREVGRDAQADVETYLRAVASLYAERVDRWLNELGNIPEEWEGTSTLSSWQFQLTAAEAAELYDGVHQVLGRYRRYDPDVPAPDGTEAYVVQAQLMPFFQQRGGTDQPAGDDDGSAGDDGSIRGGDDE
ncbi:winged helix-turn-helix transcriptional regulator [Plantactinospora sp. S1510]|uniref:Winged helix-turn-helix transcriptional regulator n=1 Tax=Plantactinospora alkalitolerans TaxID=2789879 RepID=A0ABS0GPV1_9ACTN|nr:winged helix-turn-helix domain-containing protein [Plantactinospora alkalitolerans]MBF9128190.1 winged helix-turn-helix transcriptional regulator [Plantactinospora alkalitolerans]